MHAEWVEIFQQNYKKPLRPSYTYTAIEKPDFERTTKGNRIYINNSLPEYNWNKAIHNVPDDNIQRYEYETSSASVISKHEIPEQKPMTIINVEDVESKKKVITKLPKPVTVQSVKTANFHDHEFPKTSNAVIVQHLKSTEAMVKPIKYDGFEIKPLEVYNLSDVELMTEEYTTAVINSKNIYAPLTTSATTIFEIPSEHPLVTKLPSQEFTKVTEQELFEDDWPTSEGRYEYVVQIIPNNSNKRRVDIVRNTVNPNVLKATNDNIFQSHKPTSISTSKHNLKTHSEISSFEKIFFERDTTATPKIQSSSKSQNMRQKATTKASSTTRQPEPEIETAIFEGNKEQTKLIHLSTNINPETELKVYKNKTQINSSIPTTDPDKVMIHEILKDQVMSSEITFQKVAHSNNGIIKKVYPTKIIKVDKNGHEIGGPVKLLPPTKATFINDELTIKTQQHDKKNQDLNFNKIPYQANIKPPSVMTQKRFNKTKAKEAGVIRPIATQTTQDVEAVIASVNDDEVHKNPFKSIPKSTTKKTPSLTTAETKQNFNIFDRDTGPADSGSYERYITLQHKIPEFITKEEHFNHEQDSDNSKIKDNENVDIDVQKNDLDANVNQMDTENVETSIKKGSDEMVTENPNKVNNENKQENFDTVAEDRKEETLSSKHKQTTLETLMKVLKIVTDTIKRNTRKNVNSKVRYLEDLRDTISRNIGK